MRFFLPLLLITLQSTTVASTAKIPPHPIPPYTGKFKNKEKKTIGNHNSVRQVSVTYNSADKTYSTTFGPFVKNAAAFGRFNNASNTSGWATLDINTNGGSNGLSSYYAAGLAEGVLTCHFVAAVSLNNGDVAS